MTRARSLSKLSNPATFTVDTDNNVGVNSTSPDVKLDVGGAVLVTGISTFENTTQSTSSTTGALIVSGGVGIAKSLNVGGNLSVAGTITYDDVTNIDSVGLVTARSGLRVVGGGLTVTGVSTFFDDVTFTGASSNITFDKSDNAVLFADDAELKFGDGADLKIYHDGANSIIQDVGTGDLRIAGNIVKINNFNNTATMLKATEGSSVELNHNNSKKFETTGSGAIVTGIMTATSFEGSGANLTNLPASGDSNDITACLFI